MVLFVYYIRTVDANGVKKRIRPGYIIMASRDEIFDFQGTDRDRLFQFYFGKTIRQITKEGLHFVTLDFSYAALDLQTDEVVCDFVLKEYSCSRSKTQSNEWTSLNQNIEGNTRTSNEWISENQNTRRGQPSEWATTIQSRDDENEGEWDSQQSRKATSCNEKLFNLIKFAINKFRESRNRLTLIRDIYSVNNDFVLSVFPECNACANADDCNESAPCVAQIPEVFSCQCPVLYYCECSNGRSNGCNLDPCADNECNNLATCTANGTTYTCTCPAFAGWTTSNGGKGPYGCKLY